MPNLLLIRPVRDSYPFRPLSLALLSALAKRHGWKTRLFDAGKVPHTSSRGCPGQPDPGYSDGSLQTVLDRGMVREISGTMSEFAPDLVAITVFSDNRFTAAAITHAIKQSDPRIPVLWGGVEPTINPERALQEFRADIVCRGEGIGAFEDLLQAYEKGTQISAIPNLWSRGTDGIICNPVRPLKSDLDNLPFLDMELFPEFARTREKPHGAVVGADHMITHGCPNSCSYCINAFYHSLYKRQYCIRQYSAKRIVGELRWMKERFGISFFNFHDEDFLLKDEKYLRELADAYSRDVGLPFSIQASPLSVTDEKARLLKSMNCSNVTIGIETGDHGTRNGLLGRPDSQKDIIRCIRILKQNSIRTSSFNMLALPFYSREAYEKTIDVNRTAGVDAPCALFFYPYEGTRIRDIAISHGFFSPENPKTAVHRFQVPALRFAGLGADELVGMREVFPLYCLLPAEFAPFIHRAEKQDQKGRALRALLEQVNAIRLNHSCSPSIMDSRDRNYLNQMERLCGEKGVARQEQV